MADGEGGNLDDIVQDFISTLLDKEILYPSLKELNDKFPEWLEKNKSSLSDADNKRFVNQSKVVERMCTEYESQSPPSSGGASASPSNRQSMDKLVGLMQEMRELGNPPEDLMKTIQGDGMSALDPNSCPMM